MIYVKDKFEVKIRVEDINHNVASDYFSDFKIKINDKEFNDFQFERIKENDALLKIKNVALNEPGIYVIEILDKNNLVGKSNSIKCVPDKNEFKVFWGGYLLPSRIYGFSRNYRPLL